MRKIVLLSLFLSVGLTGCLGGGSGGTSSSNATADSANNPFSSPSSNSAPSNTAPTSNNQATPFNFVKANPAPSPSTQMPGSNFSVTLTFSNPVDPASAGMAKNAQSTDTVISMTGQKVGFVAINVTTNGQNVTVTPQSPLPTDVYTLSVKSTLVDTAGQELQSAVPALSYNVKGPNQSGMLTVHFNLDNTGTNNITIDSLKFYIGTVSQANPTTGYVVNPNYNIDNGLYEPSTQTSPVIPVGTFSDQPFSFQIPFTPTSGTTYYYTLAACSSEATPGLNCSLLPTESKGQL